MEILTFFQLEELEDRLENKWSDKGCIDDVLNDGNTDCLDEVE